MTYSPRETQEKSFPGRGGSGLYWEGLFQADGFQDCHNYPVSENYIFNLKFHTLKLHKR